MAVGKGGGSPYYSESPSQVPVPAAVELYCRSVGLVGGEVRPVESWSAPPGLLLRVDGACDFYVAPDGLSVVRLTDTASAEREAPQPLASLDESVLLGPALVVSLALRGAFCLHASAALHGGSLAAFVGESGRGKSTLARHLVTEGLPGWRLVADDILPVRETPAGAEAWPRFPQLKLPVAEQPALDLPESLPLGSVCVLEATDLDTRPGIRQLPPVQALRALIQHTAGTRLFPPALLAAQMAFCAAVARSTAVYGLLYPHSAAALPAVKALLEGLGPSRTVPLRNASNPNG